MITEIAEQPLATEKVNVKAVAVVSVTTGVANIGKTVTVAAPRSALKHPFDNAST